MDSMKNEKYFNEMKRREIKQKSGFEMSGTQQEYIVKKRINV